MKRGEVIEYVGEARLRNEQPIFQGKNFIAANLHGLDLNGAAFIDCAFGRAKLIYSDLSYADFRGCVMLDAAFIGSTIAYTNFADTNLTGADFRKVIGIETANFNNAKIDSATVDLSNLLTLLERKA